MSIYVGSAGTLESGFYVGDYTGVEPPIPPEPPEPGELVKGAIPLQHAGVSVVISIANTIT